MPRVQTQQVIHSHSTLLTLIVGIIVSCTLTVQARPIPNPQEQDQPLYIKGKFSLAIPSDSTEIVSTSSVGLGTFNEKGTSAYGLRFIFIPSPPPNPLSEQKVTVDQAFGPVFDWQLFFNPSDRLIFYANTSLGFVFGQPNQRSNDEANLNDSPLPTNQIIPIFELGFGVMVVKKLSETKELFFSPEFGLLPGISAPYMSISSGVNF